MTWWKVTLKSQQSITLGTGATRAFHTPSLGYIPGSALRGALARAWLVECGEGDPRFQETFDGTLRFGPLLAENSDIASQSVARRKYWTGDDRYVDLAFQDGEDLEGAEQLKGDVMWAPGGGMRSIVRTALDEVTKTAKEGSLFSREAHRKCRTFTGHIVGDEHLVEPLRQFTRISIGGQKSVHGRCEVTIDKVAAPVVADPARVVLRTLSPSILTDDAGRPMLDIADAFWGFDVQEAWGNRLTADGVSGWHAASNTPKPSEAAIAPGAVVVLRNVDPRALGELLNRGIGTRRAEGFGWLEVVTEPWSPPVADDERSVVGKEPAEARWRQAEGWALRDRRSLANWLVELDSSADLSQIQGQRAWLNLTAEQQDVVEKVLQETPEPNRKAIASTLRRN